jgi:hypothetical protein
MSQSAGRDCQVAKVGSSEIYNTKFGFLKEIVMPALDDPVRRSLSKRRSGSARPKHHRHRPTA